MTEQPIAPLIPPSLPRPDPVEPLPVAPLPTVPGRVDLLLGVAAVSHSGRVRDQPLLDALGWTAGDLIAVEIRDSTLLLRRDPAGPYRINARGQVFLPAGARTLLGITANSRVALVAIPARNLLLVHPCVVVTALLAGFYDTFLDGGPHEP